MSVLIGTNAGAHLVCDVTLDSSRDRLTALDRRVSPLTSWTVSHGQVLALRDGADAVEVDVELTGPLAAVVVRLSVSAGVVLAASRPVTLASGDKARLVFRVARAGAREEALAAAVP